MQKSITYRKILSILTLLIMLPAILFITTSVLKYGLGINGPYDTLSPSLEKMGITESLGWNINLLILSGPLLAIIISLIQVLRIEHFFSNEELQFRVVIKKKRLPIIILLLGTLSMATLFLYLTGENCKC